MSDFVFRINPNIIIGDYTVSRLGQQVREWGTRFFVVLDPILREVKLAEKVQQALSEHKIETIVYSELTDGTSTKAVARALKLAREAHVHGVIAVGGMKAMTIGRAVAAYYNEVHDFYTFVGGAQPNAQPIHCICVPTVFRFPFIFTSDLPIADSRNHQIKILKIQPNVCKLALVDPNLMLSLTDNQKATLSLELLGMAIEAYISQKANFFSDMFAEKAVEILNYAFNGSPSIEITTPEEVLLAQAGAMVSMAASTSALGMNTLLSIGINARYQIKKPLLASILLPFAMEDAGKFKAAKLEKLSHLLGAATEEQTGEEAVSAFIDYVRQRIAAANLPTRLKDTKLTIEQLAVVIEDIKDTEIMNQLPRSMTADDLFTFIKQAY
ncbi:Alcohol dehydrogenase, class IV [Treponema sp. JC4]|uniref:iron-containing alcohol dehydrogenase n=1 Tax=Treponema sp. JC4 TaxID=1124982 RepID=UPI00025B0C6E|nr:iron-containing alcohol dehydrogenase [Treponema sp. JC4]EID84908.1 Alcohol dehydrogenase, class IV [Treponema sp. JC4]